MNTPLGDSTIHLVDRSLKPKTWDMLVADRRNAAFRMVGAVDALLIISKAVKMPMDVSGLQPLMDQYKAAEKALSDYKGDYSIYDKVRDEALGD